MKSLTEQDIRNSFINCSKGDAKRLAVPRDLGEQPWGDLDFLGWRRDEIGATGVVVVAADPVLGRPDLPRDALGVDVPFHEATVDRDDLPHPKAVDRGGIVHGKPHGIDVRQYLEHWGAGPSASLDLGLRARNLPQPGLHPLDLR